MGKGRDSCLVTRTHFASPRDEKCRLGQLGGAGQTAAGPAGDARVARGAATARGKRRDDGESISMIPASLSSC